MMSLTAGFLSTAVCNNLKLKSQVPIRHNSYQFDAPKARGSDIKRVKGYEYEKGQYLLIEQQEIRSWHRRLGGPWRLANSCLSPRSILFILILLTWQFPKSPVQKHIDCSWRSVHRSEAFTHSRKDG